MPDLIAASFSAFRKQHPQGRFSDWLALRASPFWEQATTHPFTQAIGDATMPEAAYARYLIEDYTFVTDLASTLGFLVAKAPDMKTKARLSAFLALLTSEENDYFIRSFEELNVPPAVYETASQGKVTQAFSSLLLEASGQGSFEDGLTCLLCAEWCYLTWGLREAQKPQPKQFYLAEWIELHAVAGFADFVNWLREQIDQIGLTLSEERQEDLAQLFRQMSYLETAFFEAAWTNRIPDTLK